MRPSVTAHDDIKNYVVTVIKLPPKEKIEGLDALVKVEVFGNSVLISKDSDPNELYLFFIAGCKIHHDFLSNNHLYRESTLNITQTKTGFFEPNGRVKAIKFKGVISTGFIIPLNSLSYLGETYTTCINGGLLKEGVEFNYINSILISDKFVKKNQQPANNSPKTKSERKIERFDLIIPNQFRFHQSTAHLARNLTSFGLNDLVVITEKYHGTSAVFANVLTRKKLTFFERILKKLGFNIIESNYHNLYSSRTVLKNRYINPNQDSFYDVDVWGYWNNKLKDFIDPGITLYGEIIGYLPNNKVIQKDYAYNLPTGTSEFLVYRMTYTKPDGSLIELSWNQIKGYCKKHSLKHVDELFYGFVREIPVKTLVDGQLLNWEDAFFASIQAKYAYEQDCKYNKGMPAEGVVVRNDSKLNFESFKLKNRRFIEKESKMMDKGEDNIEDDA